MNNIHIEYDDNGKPIVDGDFSFEMGPLIFRPDYLSAYKEIKFQFNPECPADLGVYLSNEEVHELIAEKLKQNFIKFLQNA